MKAVIYARYSSDSQREASIEGQLRDCKDYAEKNGITVVGTYIDRAYSAKTDDRPDFQRMIKDSAKKIFDVVLVWKLDRFARNRFDAVNYKYQLEKNGVHLVSAMEPISQGPEGIMVESMLIGMAEYYSAELALKVARGERENALQCKYNGGVVPLGFTIGKEDRLYHIDPETAPIVQEIFTRYADGEPAEKIAASLNERGLRTRTGKPFVKNSFFQIFRNRRYIGEYRYKDIVTPGGIPAIVDQDLFDRVQQRFEQNRIAHGRPAKEDVSYLLTTKLFCGKCGTLMGGESGTSHMGNTYYYYKCGNAKRHGKAHCDLKAIRKEPLERFVVETAIKVIFSDEIIERLIDLIMEAQQQENTRLPVLKDQLRDTEKRLANLLEAIEQGILTPTTKQRLDELEARKEALNTSILEEELKKPVLTREWMRFWFEKFRKGDMRDMEHQRQIIDTFVNSVYVFDDRVVLNFNFTDDSKTISREEVLGSSAVENAPPRSPDHLVWGFFCGGRYRTRTATTTTAACGRNREELLGPHSDFSKPCQGAAEKSANATRKAPPKGWGEQSILSFAVFLPDAVQAICDQSLAVADGGAAGIPDGAGQIAGGVKGSLRAKLGAEPRGQTVQLAGGAQHKAVLQAGRGAFAQDGGRSAGGQVDLGQLGGVLHQRLQRKLRPGQDHAAHQLLLLVDRHHGNGRVGRNDHQRPGTLCQSGNGTAQQFGTQLGRIVQPQLDAALQPRPHGQDARTAQDAQGRQHPAAQHRHHTAQNAALDLIRGCAVQRKQIDQPDGVFVDGGGRVRMQPTAEPECVVVVAAHSDMGVADVDGEDHEKGPPLQRNIMYI